MARSDIFIYKVGNGHKPNYWVYPSPFVAYSPGTRIQFRNLTSDDIAIDLKAAPVNEGNLTLRPGESGSVTLKADAGAGLYEYAAVATEGGGSATATRQRSGPKPRKPKTFEVRGGSSPKIIIDT